METSYSSETTQPLTGGSPPSPATTGAKQFIPIIVMTVLAAVTIAALTVVTTFLVVKTARPIPIIKPKKLTKGKPVVGLFSPASPVPLNETQYINKLNTELKETLQFADQFKIGPHVFDKTGYLAGADGDRANDFNTHIKDKEVNWVIASRGGYGCPRLLSLIKFEDVRNNPKIVMGYSDLTALVNSIFFQAGVVAFHGPMVVNSWVNSWPGTDYNINSRFVEKLLFNNELVTYSNPPANPTKVINAGKARGRIVGGNLSVFSGLVSSPYLPPYTKIGVQWKDVILFLEEVSEPSYKIDRYLSMLKFAGILDQVAGVVFGTCSGCSEDGLKVSELLSQYVQKPCFMGMLLGHDGQNMVLPIGIQAEMDADAGTLTLLEKALED